MERYFLIGPKKSSNTTAYKLLIVMPGGDGSADFNPFVRRIWKSALPDNYIVAELVAPRWSPTQFDQLVWPTKKMPYPGAKFSTEDFIRAVVQDVSKKYKVDEDKIFSLSWSSGGPAAYAAALSHGPIRGSLVAMSVFHPEALPPLSEAAGQSFFILHSAGDQLIPLSQAQDAADELQKAGAKTKLVTYSGGHGWAGFDVFGTIREGVLWLEKPSG
jgi:predicted esterase